MAIRDLETLNDELQRELAWRKKELSDLKIMVQETSEKRNHDTALRSGLPLLYAHWEGFVKYSLSFYLEYVSKQKITYNKLNDCFLALTLKKDIDIFSNSGNTKSDIHIKTVKRINELKATESSIPYKKQIDTKSNLNSTLFKELMTMVGLDFREYEPSFKMIDSELLNMRNQIAHGSHLQSISLDKDTYIQIHEKIIFILERLKNEIYEYAEKEMYLKN